VKRATRRSPESGEQQEEKAVENRRQKKAMSVSSRKSAVERVDTQRLMGDIGEGEVTRERHVTLLRSGPLMASLSRAWSAKYVVLTGGRTGTDVGRGKINRPR